MIISVALNKYKASSKRINQPTMIMPIPASQSMTNKKKRGSKNIRKDKCCPVTIPNGIRAVAPIAKCMTWAIALDRA